ncbi:MAG TPA: DMT family transporter [Caulobacteraceae bacterium]|nr:DMT family transporter [Caulobacteraceae bacterium]
MLFIPITIAAATFQVARNATQRTLMGAGGPWGATLVRFLYGLPFTAVFLALAWMIWPNSTLAPSGFFFAASAVGGAAQIGATAALLSAMQRSSFALGTAFQQSLLPFTSLIGFFVFGDVLSPLQAVGIAVVTLGVGVLSWPKDGVHGDWSGAWFALLAGACFAVSNNAFRQAGLSLGDSPAALRGVTTVLTVQAMQSAALIAALSILDRTSLIAAFTNWKPSMRAGFFGAAASACWFTALAMAPAGPVRAVGVVEMPLAALAGQRLFSEKLTPLQWLVGAVTALGVVLAALG